MLNKFFLILTLNVLFLFIFTNISKAVSPKEARLFLFHSENCSFCQKEIKFLKVIEKKYPDLKIYSYEVSGDFKNQNIFSKVIENYKLNGGVPVSIIGDKAIEGFNQPQIEESIVKCLKEFCNNDFLNNLLGLEPIKAAEIEKVSGEILPENFNEEENENKNLDNFEENSIRLLLLIILVIFFVGIIFWIKKRGKK